MPADDNAAPVLGRHTPISATCCQPTTLAGQPLLRAATQASASAEQRRPPSGGPVSIRMARSDGHMRLGGFRHCSASSRTQFDAATSSGSSAPTPAGPCPSVSGGTGPSTRCAPSPGLGSGTARAPSPCRTGLWGGSCGPSGSQAKSLRPSAPHAPRPGSGASYTSRPHPRALRPPSPGPSTLTLHCTFPLLNAALQTALFRIVIMMIAHE